MTVRDAKICDFTQRCTQLELCLRRQGLFLLLSSIDRLLVVLDRFRIATQAGVRESFVVTDVALVRP